MRPCVAFCLWKIKPHEFLHKVPTGFAGVAGVVFLRRVLCVVEVAPRHVPDAQGENGRLCKSKQQQSASMVTLWHQAWAPRFGPPKGETTLEFFGSPWVTSLPRWFAWTWNTQPVLCCEFSLIVWGQKPGIQLNKKGHLHQMFVLPDGTLLNEHKKAYFCHFILWIDWATNCFCYDHQTNAFWCINQNLWPGPALFRSTSSLAPRMFYALCVCVFHSWGKVHSQKITPHWCHNVPSQCLLKITTMVKQRPMKAAKRPKSLKGLHIFISFQSRASDIFRCLSIIMFECCGLSFIIVRTPAMVATVVVVSGHFRFFNPNFRFFQEFLAISRFWWLVTFC